MDPTGFPSTSPRRSAARDGVRAYASAALGLLGDPEDRGSILRLMVGSNYVLRTGSSTLLQTIL